MTTDRSSVECGGFEFFCLFVYVCSAGEEELTGGEVALSGCVVLVE